MRPRPPLSAGSRPEGPALPGSQPPAAAGESPMRLRAAGAGPLRIGLAVQAAPLRLWGALAPTRGRRDSRLAWGCRTGPARRVPGPEPAPWSGARRVWSVRASQAQTLRPVRSAPRPSPQPSLSCCHPVASPEVSRGRAGPPLPPLPGASTVPSTTSAQSMLETSTAEINREILPITLDISDVAVS